jgi:ribonuclease M5
MVSVKEVIVVEGRYDKNALSQIVDATIVETGGFGVFRDRERLALLRAMAARCGIVVLTDSDGAGFVIRNFLKGANIPDIYGKEKRKSSPSREGKLGVEGMAPEVIVEALRRSGATLSEAVKPAARELTNADFYALGLSGPGSTARRAALLRRLGLPEKMSAVALRQALQVLMTRTELEAAVLALEQGNAHGGEAE